MVLPPKDVLFRAGNQTHHFFRFVEIVNPYCLKTLLFTLSLSKMIQKVSWDTFQSRNGTFFFSRKNSKLKNALATSSFSSSKLYKIWLYERKNRFLAKNQSKMTQKLCLKIASILSFVEQYKVNLTICLNV